MRIDALLQRLKLDWNPQTISAPQVDHELANLNGVQRMVESIRFFALTVEHWVSSDGVLREWLRIMLKIALVIVCPLAIFMPTVTFALWQIALWTAFLVVITKNLLLFPLTALAAITVIGVLVITLRSFVRALTGFGH
jgi:hypothetical protein